MVKTGFFLDIAGVLLLCVWSYLMLPVVWGVEYGVVPEWALESNITNFTADTIV